MAGWLADIFLLNILMICLMKLPDWKTHKNPYCVLLQCTGSSCSMRTTEKKIGWPVHVMKRSNNKQLQAKLSCITFHRKMISFTITKKKLLFHGAATFHRFNPGNRWLFLRVCKQLDMYVLIQATGKWMSKNYLENCVFLFL